jgi:hypothetical protein
MGIALSRVGLDYILRYHRNWLDYSTPRAFSRWTIIISLPFAELDDLLRVISILYLFTILYVVSINRDTISSAV